MAIKHIAAPRLLFALGACMTPVGDTALSGSTWRFASIDGAAPVSAQTSLAFGDRLSASAGCNSLSGPWRLEAGRVVAGPLVATRKFCAGLMDQESAVSALLSGNPTAVVAGNQLTLSGGGHSAVLTRTN